MPTWDEILKDLRELTTSRRFRSATPALNTEDFEDLRQRVALHVLEVLGARPTVRAFFPDRRRRRAYLAVVLRRMGQGEQRKRLRRLELLREQAPLLDRSEHALDPVVGRAIADEVVTRIADAALSPEAWFALQTLEGEITLAHYAAEHGLSERTARRHLIDGMSQLAQIASGNAAS